jgi:hypothetical protein
VPPNAKRFVITSNNKWSITFREEYLELLHRSGVEFDERYL